LLYDPYQLEGLSPLVPLSPLAPLAPVGQADQPAQDTSRPWQSNSKTCLFHALARIILHNLLNYINIVLKEYCNYLLDTVFMFERTANTLKSDREISLESSRYKDHYITLLIWECGKKNTQELKKTLMYLYIFSCLNMIVNPHRDQICGGNSAINEDLYFSLRYLIANALIPIDFSRLLTTKEVNKVFKEGFSELQRTLVAPWVLIYHDIQDYEPRLYLSEFLENGERITSNIRVNTEMIPFSCDDLDSAVLVVLIVLDRSLCLEAIVY
jgi:hypothetical protein